MKASNGIKNSGRKLTSLLLGFLMLFSSIGLSQGAALAGGEPEIPAESAEFPESSAGSAGTVLSDGPGSGDGDETKIADAPQTEPVYSLTCDFRPHVHSAECWLDGRLICGYSETYVHTHSLHCYDEEANLVCGLVQAPAHAHTESCYETERTLICEIPEGSGSHMHDETCYTRTRGEEAICGLEENEGHQHGEACFVRNLICGKEETEGHNHQDSCRETVRICGLEENPGHQHSEACVRTVLTCGLEEGAGAHTHGEGCYAPGCGQEEKDGHVHGEGCFDENGELICQIPEGEGAHHHGEGCMVLTCGLEENEGHRHNEDCRSAEYICGLREGEGAHTHGEACYETRLICGKEEIPAHHHSDECFETTQICGLEAGEGAHRHTDACYAWTDQLTCGQVESAGHVHGEECYEETSHLVCEFAKVHQHTEDCFETGPDGRRICACGYIEVLSHNHSDACVTAVYEEIRQTKDSGGSSEDGLNPGNSNDEGEANRQNEPEAGNGADRQNESEDGEEDLENGDSPDGLNQADKEGLKDGDSEEGQNPTGGEGQEDGNSPDGLNPEGEEPVDGTNIEEGEAAGLLNQQGASDSLLKEGALVNLTGEAIPENLLGEGALENLSGDVTTGLLNGEGTAEDPLNPDENAASEESAPATYTVEYTAEFITGFAELGLEQEFFAYADRPELAEVLAELPAHLTVSLGGTAVYDTPDDGFPALAELTDAEETVIPVTWTCLLDYENETETDQFEFLPELEGYRLAEGISLPVIYVYVNDPYLGLVGGYSPYDFGFEIPFVQSLAEGVQNLVNEVESLLNYSASDASYTNTDLPSIRNQGSAGTCWTFTSIGAIETDLIRAGADKKEINLSELYLAYYATHSYVDPKGGNVGDEVSFTGTGGYQDNGGNSVMAYRTMVNMAGIVNETSAPYTEINNDEYVPDSIYSDTTANATQITGVYIINPGDRAGIKQAILDHGSVEASMYVPGNYPSYYNSDKASFYQGSYPYANHAILLVGWDDNFSAQNFSVKPSGNGAWRARNSWGGGNNTFTGYFWISYYDAGLMSDTMVAYDAESASYDYCYAYDGAAYPDWTFVHNAQQSESGTSPASTTVSQKYTVDEGETIQAAGFEIGTVNVTASIKLTCGGQTRTATKNTTYAGFYLVPLEDLTVTQRAEAVLTITFTASQTGDTLRIPFERTGETVYAGDVTFTASCAGGGLTMDGDHYDYDSRMKIYTKKTGTSGATSVRLKQNGTPVSQITIGDETVQLTAEVSPASSGSGVTWSSANPYVASVDQSGNVTGHNGGTTVVTAIARNGVLAACTVEVNVPVTGIAISGLGGAESIEFNDTTTPNFEFGDTLMLTCEVKPANALNKRVEWRSSDPTVGKIISTSGLNVNIKLLKNGSTTITVLIEDGGSSYSASVPVKVNMQWPVNGVTVSQTQASVIRGSTLQLYANVMPVRAKNRNLSWISNNPGVASVNSESGLVTGNTEGTAVITAETEEGGFTASCIVTVVPIPVSSVSMSRNSATLYEGETLRLSATAYPTNAKNRSLIWSSSNPAMATVDASGLVTAIRDGTVNIYASAMDGSGVVGTCTVTVKTRDLVEAFVYRMYRVCLLREPDRQGLGFWVDKLRNGLTGAQVIEGFYNSQEMRESHLSNGEFITRAYTGILGRYPDSEGYKFWSNLMDSGASGNVILKGFVKSPEFTSLCEEYGIVRGTYEREEARDINLGITGFVSRIYQKALGRTFDVQGINYWCNILLQDPSRENMIHVAKLFLFSEEFTSFHLSDTEFVKVLYRTFLGRECEQSGFDFWTNLLNNGETWESIIPGFAYSEEFSNIMAGYGL